MYEREDFWEIVKDVIHEKINQSRVVRWYLRSTYPIRRFIYRTRQFIVVLRRLEQYRYIAESIYNPWFDISEGSDMLYMSNPENLRCRFCGCKYVPYDADAWMHATHDEMQNHHENCLWLKIDKIQRV